MTNDNELPINNEQPSNIDSQLVNTKNELTSVPKERELTPQNRVFLQCLMDGMSTLDAYSSSGYKGSKHAAYQLRSDLKEHLIQCLEAKGIDRAGLMQEVLKLNALPLADTQITLKHKLDLLKLLHKMVGSTPAQAAPKITAFVVNNTITPNSNTNVIDVTDS